MSTLRSPKSFSCVDERYEESGVLPTPSYRVLSQRTMPERLIEVLRELLGCRARSEDLVDDAARVTALVSTEYPLVLAT